MSETNSRPKFRWSPDGQKILLASNTAVVINTLNRIVETVVENPSLAEWAPDSDGIYYFTFQDGLLNGPGDFYFRPLGSAQAIKLKDKEQVKALDLTGVPLVQGYDPLVLSRSGSRLAIWGSSVLTETGVAKGPTCVLHIYNLEKGKIDKLAKPFKTLQTKELCLAFDWSPDENSLAAVASEGPSIIGIKLIELKTGDWRILATVPTGGESYYPFYLYGFKVMSWAQ